MTKADQHVTEEPQEERGAPGSRDTGDDEPGGGPADRPEGAIEGAEEVPSLGVTGEEIPPAVGTMPPQDTKPATPPYEGRQTTASGTAPADTGGARTGGATGPQADSAYKAPAPDSTPGGATASPADEQPAAESGGERSPDMTGPAHVAGTGRGEDKL
jgi:hypothetical protein